MTVANFSSQRRRYSQSAARNRRRVRAILRVPIRSRERQVRPARWVRLCEQRLVNGNVTASKSVRRAGNIKTPYAIRRLVDESECFIVVRFPTGKSAGLFVDLAHRNQTNVSCDAQIRRTMSSAASSSRHLRSPLAMGEQRTAGSW
jgi:hypothetical protein